MRGTVFFAAIAAACGGTTTNVDGGVDASSDVIALDAAECVPPNTTCANPCPSGTYCLRVSGPTEADLGCTPIPPECNGTPSCACMTDCFCTGSAADKCSEGSGFLLCDNGLKSRREYKKDIAYVDDARRAELATKAMTPLHASNDMELYGEVSTLLAAVQQQQREIDSLKRELADARGVCAP